MDPKKYKDLVFDIIGSAMAVHNELNWGLLEALYNEAMHIELQELGIDHRCEDYLPCFYKGRKMNKSYQMDIVVGDVIVELKSVENLVSAHRAQLFNYLRLTKKPIGLLINFGEPSLRTERYAYFEGSNECRLLDANMEIVPKRFKMR